MCVLLLTHRCGTVLYNGLHNSMLEPLSKLMTNNHKEELLALKALFTRVHKAIKSTQAGTNSTIKEEASAAKLMRLRIAK